MSVSKFEELLDMKQKSLDVFIEKNDHKVLSLEKKGDHVEQLINDYLREMRNRHKV